MKKRALMKTAEVWAEESYCKRNKVGAVISLDERVLSTGYNGTPNGSDNNCEETINGNIITKDTVIHAEANAILFAAKNGIPLNNCVLYVTLSPCKECAKMIIQSGIKKVIYKTKYRDLNGIDFLLKYNIDVEQYKDGE